MLQNPSFYRESQHFYCKFSFWVPVTCHFRVNLVEISAKWAKNPKKRRKDGLFWTLKFIPPMRETKIYNRNVGIPDKMRDFATSYHLPIPRYETWLFLHREIVQNCILYGTVPMAGFKSLPWHFFRFQSCFYTLGQLLGSAKKIWVLTSPPNFIRYDWKCVTLQVLCFFCI